ncbi:uncharacterized protein [Dendrobates tinctorius]|uniref:uncharacterized protein n=1 Tax=Dendrobates tinctorius TaxID=92724 RepID=UPI003CC9A0F3
MEGRSCFPLDSVDNLVKSVRSTMGCEEPRGAQTAQDIMFAGLAEKKRRAFPVIPAIKALIKREWEKHDQRSFLPSASKRKYPFSDEELLKWTKVPKVDAVISSTSKQSAIPVEDAGLLADPLDHKAESSLKRSWESTTGIFKPAVASTCTTRSMLVWLDQLDQQIEQKVSREKLRAAIPLIRGAAAFMADASADTLRLAARSAALVNNARRALWMKSWKGDAQSKAKICATPCEGEPLRGDRLEEGGKRKDQIDGPQKKRNKRVPCSGVQHSEGKIEIKKSDPPVGGRLRFFYPKWEQISSNPWILGFIKEGMKIEFLQNPYDFFILTRLNSMAQQKALEEEIRSLLCKGVLVEVPEGQEGRGFYSPLFLISKPDGTFRTIINLRKLNTFIKNYKFKMESIRSTIKLLFPNCVVAGIDLKDAYYHLPIHNRYQKYLRVAVVFDGKVRHFQYTAMPFGLSTAPRIFTKVMAEVMAYVRQKDTLIVPYLDDFLIIGNSDTQCTERVADAISSLQDLGWIINIQKSRLVPQSLQMFLGFQLNSITQKCLLPQVKIALTKEKVEAAIDRPRMSLRGAMSLLGSLDSCAPAVRWAHYHVRTLQHQILQEERRHGGHLESKITLTQVVLTSLEWWLDDDHLSSGVPWVIVPSGILTTDASPQGWGAHMGNSFCQGRWNREEREYSSNLKELTAVYYALHHFLPQLQQKHVRILSDNTTTVAYINRQGGTRSETLMSSAARILSLAESNLLSLSALHIRGEDNQEADFLSRHTLRQGEWCLNRQIFQNIVALWGHPQVDLFATRENRQTKTFASLSPADHPDILDALQASWKFKLAYAFPPLILLPQVIRKIREEKARVILIAPFWPKRPWFSWLRIMSVKDPWVLPSNPNLLSQGPFFHPQVDNLHLTAWNLKGTY